METSNKNSENLVHLFPKKKPELSSVEVTKISISMRTLTAWALAEIGVNLSGDEIEIASKDPELAEAICRAILDVKRKIKEIGIDLEVAVKHFEIDSVSDAGSEMDTPNNILDFDSSKRRKPVPSNSSKDGGDLIRFVSLTEQNLIAAKQKVRADKKAKKAKKTEEAKKAWIDAFLRIQEEM